MLLLFKFSCFQKALWCAINLKKIYNDMTFNDVQELANSHESQSVELKKTTGQLDAGMETLCAFLNGDGGTVLFGVTDKGEIKGQEVSDGTKRNIAEAISRFEPKPVVHIEYIDVPDSDGRKVIVFRVDSQHILRPFAFRGRAFHRIQSVTSIMSQEEYRYFLFSKVDDKYSWDRMLNPGLRLTDLDENTFWGAIRAGINSGRLPEVTIKESMGDILEKLELFRDGQLTNAAAVLFGKQRIGYMQWPFSSSTSPCLQELMGYIGRRSCSSLAKH